MKPQLIFKLKSFFKLLSSFFIAFIILLETNKILNTKLEKDFLLIIHFKHIFYYS